MSGLKQGSGSVMSGQDRARIAAAEQAIEVMGKEFDASLPGRLAEMATALKDGDRPAALAGAYGLKGAAGSFGWTMLGTAANFMLHAIEGVADDSQLATNDVVKVHMDALRTLSLPVMKGEVPEGQVLVRSLYALLDRRGLLPEL